ncbi:hypothetical protein BDA96_07G010900 [Sorghum bicolor]|uniref:Uncharacterized protein n=2 Tax=Sorghum bicolor TaxID=4558 RepID=A0A921QID1_SORBI|nr:hypothetical protein BDA96_07G010900 [Sorghum bicolor]OQU79770.1 hypothetical protein SORBI_3007G010350 [Sorghum bicolor]
MAAVDDVDALVLLDFHESRAGVRGLVESGGAAAVPGALGRPNRRPLPPALFQVTNHGVPAGTVEAFNEQPLASRSAYYVLRLDRRACHIYTIPARNAGQPAMARRREIVLRLGHGESYLDHLPAACLDALLEYHRSLTVLGKKMIAGLLSEALGVAAGQGSAVHVEATLMQCHYYPPCPHRR